MAYICTVEMGQKVKLFFGRPLHTILQHKSPTNLQPKTTFKTRIKPYKTTILIFVALAIGVTSWNGFSTSGNVKGQTASLGGSIKKTNLSAFPIIVPTIKYGFALDTFHVTKDTIREGQFLAELLLPHKVDYQKIDQLARNVQDTFSVTKLRAYKAVSYTHLTLPTICSV